MIKKKRKKERPLNKNGIVSMNRYDKRIKSMLGLPFLPISFQVYFVDWIEGEGQGRAGRHKHRHSFLAQDTSNSARAGFSLKKKFFF